MKLMKLILILLLSVSAGSGTAAEVIEASVAFELLRDNTFSGTNAKGQDFWFYQSSSGEFEAKFKKSYGSASYYSGKWYAKGADRICWDWKGGNVHCYVKFEREGGNIDMTRSDGLVHSGAILSGNPEEL